MFIILLIIYSKIIDKCSKYHDVIIFALLNYLMKFNIINIPKTDSTNIIAQQLIAKGELNEGDVIYTDRQENGIGQGKNLWESEYGKNLTFSLILEPWFLSPSNQFVLNQCISMAILDTIGFYLSKSNYESKVKWPNDIYVNNNKIAGVLFQNFVSANVMDYAIAGIGLNVNQRQFSDSLKNPISLANCISIEISLDEIMNQLLDNISTRYSMLKADMNFALLKKEYLGSLYLYNTWSKFKDNDSVFEGKITNIDGFGRLEITTRSNIVRLYMFKEVEFVIDDFIF